MKLYTEEQVKQIVEKSRETGLTADYLMLVYTPIELPSEGDIIEASHTEIYQVTFNPFASGALWMRDKITNHVPDVRKMV